MSARVSTNGLARLYADERVFARARLRHPPRPRVVHGHHRVHAQLRGPARLRDARWSLRRLPLRLACPDARRLVYDGSGLQSLSRGTVHRARLRARMYRRRGLPPPCALFEVSAEFPVNPDDVLPVSCARAGSASTTRPGSGPVCNEARGLTCPAGALWHSDRRESPALSSWRRPSRCESDDREPGSFSNARASSSSTSSAIAALSSPNVDSTKPRGRGPSRHFPRPTSEEAPASRRCGEPPTSDDERPSSTPKRSPPLPLVRPCGVVVLRWPPA